MTERNRRRACMILSVELAYVDESGSVGFKQGSSATYTLGCVTVPAEIWPDAFDAFIAYRRFLRREFGIPVRAELKANWLVRGTGSIEPYPTVQGSASIAVTCD